MTARRTFRTVLGVACALAAAVVLAVAGLLTVARVEHDRAFTLPAPSGPFAVGRMIETWTDQRRPDPVVPNEPTRLVAWIWYPAAPSPGAEPADYLPADWQREMARRQGRLLGTFLSRDLSLARTHSVTGAALSPERPRYPVVVLRGGLGALIFQYTTLAEDLASHGYVVVGFDAPYLTSLVVFDDGQVVTRPDSLNPETLTGEPKVRLATRLLGFWVSDVGFALDRLEQLNASAAGPFGGRLDLGKIGVVGHSLGGASAAQFCHDDDRCGAGVDMDGLLLGSVVRDGLRRPFMFLLSDHGNSLSADDRKVVADMQSVYDRLPRRGRVAFVVGGAGHFTFSDQFLIRPPVLVRALRLAGLVGLEPRRGLRITAAAVRSFLDVHLKGAPTRSLDELPRTYPELRPGPR